MKRTCVFLLSTCLAVGGAIFVTDPANAEPKIAKVGNGVSKAGRTLPSAINTILSGVGTPSASLGRDGDFYIDRKAWQFFGPKTKGRWPLPVLLVGPSGGPGPSGAPGPTGPQGKVGVKGEGGNSGATGSSSITAGSAGPIGPSGPGGAPGPIGAAGAPGSPGATGPVGLSGAPGSTGSAGPTGATGGSGLPGPTGAGGSTGATGVQGLKGDTGSTGLAGAPGTIGPRGPSKTFSGALNFAGPISGVGGATADSSPFGIFEVGSNYAVTIAVEAWCPTSAFDSPTVTLKIYPTLSPAIISLWQNSHIGQKRFGTSKLSSTIIQAHVIVDGSAVTSGYSIVVAVIDHDVTTAAPVSVEGYFVATQVDSVA
jgi:hypothetical protein